MSLTLAKNLFIARSYCSGKAKVIAKHFRFRVDIRLPTRMCKASSFELNKGDAVLTNKSKVQRGHVLIMWNVLMKQFHCERARSDIIVTLFGHF